MSGEYWVFEFWLVFWVVVDVLGLLAGIWLADVWFGHRRRRCTGAAKGDKTDGPEDQAK